MKKIFLSLLLSACSTLGVNGQTTTTQSTGGFNNAGGTNPNVSTATGILPIANGGSASSLATGSGLNVLQTSPTLITPLLGTPTSGTLTNCTGLPVATGISGLGSNVATLLATPSSANVAAAVTDEIGTGNVVLSDLTISAPSASYTLALTDKSTLVRMNVGSANNLEVPANATVAFPVGSQIMISQAGAGQTTIVAAGGVTINSAGAALKLVQQHSAATLIKVATNTWLAVGDLTP